MFTAILSEIPPGVFPLFLALVWLGFRASRRRRTPLWLLYALPFLVLTALVRVQAMGAPGLTLAALAAGWAAGAVLGYRLQPRWTLARDRTHAELAGEWMTLTTLMAIFALNFATGMILGMAPALAAGPGFGTLFGLLSGGLSGSFAGRAIRIAQSAPD